MKNFFLLLLIGGFAVGCKKGSDTDGARLVMDITGLEDLGPSAQYEGWIIVNGVPKSTGKFMVSPSGELSETTFSADASDMAAATEFVLTVEPVPDPDAGPSQVKLLAGTFVVNTADVHPRHQAALGNDFTGVLGEYAIATPTTATTADEKSGVWFINTDDANPKAGLYNLPALPAGWQYEGWAVINGVPVSTGKFMSAGGADNSAAYSGPLQGPPFPGEDFIQNAPAGLTFPTDLTGSKIAVTIEPEPDNSPAPFVLKPLENTVPNPVSVMANYPLINHAVASFPKGTVKR